MSKTELEEKFGMVQYITYDNDGNILKTGICQTDMIEKQKESNQKVMKQKDQNMVVHDDTHIIKNGNIIEKEKKKEEGLKL